MSGLATLVEQVRRTSRVPWGPGRWAWAAVASYLLLTLVDEALGTIAIRFTPGIFIQNSVTTDILNGVRGRYGEFWFPSMTWFLLALGLTSLAVRATHTNVCDAREWCGRGFAGLLVTTGLALRALLLLGFRHQIMGGGM